MNDAMPLYARFPALRLVGRVDLGAFPSPVSSLDVAGSAGELWVKRDDLNAAEYGGNKVRSLEFLLSGMSPGDMVLTLGGQGSTHVMTTAAHARRFGVRTRAVRWRHEMNPMATLVAERTIQLGTEVVEVRTVVGAHTRAAIERMRRRARWIPLGGTSPRGVLGHVNAALELAGQVSAGLLPSPDRVVVPLGTAGTAAGLALGFAIAGLPASVVGARVAPRVVTNTLSVHLVARSAGRLIGRVTGERMPRLSRSAVEVRHDAYAGAYGRPYPGAREGAALLESSLGARLDDTYSAKAFAVALDIVRRRRGVTLFWLTFDSRWTRT